MKKLFLTITLMLATIAGFAQSATDIVNTMKAEEGVETQVLTKMMLQMQFAQAPDEKIKELGKKINSMTIMSLAKASEQAKTKFQEMISQLTDNGYEMTEEQEEMGIKAKGFIKKDGETITEVVSIVEAEGETAFILISGKFTEEDLERLNNM